MTKGLVKLISCFCLVFIFASPVSVQAVGCSAENPADECGVCGGQNKDKDCAGVCFGTAKLDCAGVCNGSSVIDDCGVCGGLNLNKDCFGVCFGTAKNDSCGVCNGGNLNKDCDGVCFGTATKDYCGVCNGNGLSCKNPACTFFFPYNGQTASIPMGCLTIPNGYQLCSSSSSLQGWIDTSTDTYTSSAWFLPQGIHCKDHYIQHHASISTVFRYGVYGNKLCGCVRQAGYGCFPPGTKITMADGSEKNIEDIRVGESVWNPVLDKAVKIKQIIESAEKEPLIRLTYASGDIRVTQTHPVVTPDGIVQARDLAVGDKILDGTTRVHELLVVEELPVKTGQWVVNLILESSADVAPEQQHLLLSDGVITGDMLLQNLYAAE